MPDKPAVVREVDERLTGEYIANQYISYRSASYYQDHKRRMDENTRLYRNQLNQIEGGEDLPDKPLGENKYKNAMHDLVRLATEAKPVPHFVVLGDAVKDHRQAVIREQIADTIWEFGRGPSIERKLYMDMLGGGFAAVALYYKKSLSSYPLFKRLNPLYCYPKVHDGILDDLLYVETMPKSQARRRWPELPISVDPQNDKDVTIATLYDEKAVSVAVLETRGAGEKVVGNWIVDNWTHELDCVPVAFKALDTFDDDFRGLLDGLAGPQILNNRILQYLDDYLEEMVHAPYEERGIINSDVPPAPNVVYHHDINVEGETHMRRIAPAAPAGAVFGLINEVQTQLGVESLQPPARVGQVSQSIASGNFVNSTQGGLSSAVKELQDLGGDLRYQIDYIAFKIDEKYLDMTKPLLRAVGKKAMYTPSKDINGTYFHRILFGAGAGVDRQYADTRVLQHHGARLISSETARHQIEYLDNPTAEQDMIDREELAMIMKQKFAADPAAPMALLAQAILEMADGKSLIESMEAIAPELVRIQQEQQAAALPQPQPGTPGPLAGPEGAEEEALALEKGAMPEEPGPEFERIAFPPPAMQQQFVTTGG